VAIWGETDGLLLSRDRFAEIGNVTQTLKSTLERGSEAIERCSLMRVTIWGKTRGLPLGRDRSVNIGNLTQALKPHS
jgi:hypothetical protein